MIRIYIYIYNKLLSKLPKINYVSENTTKNYRIHPLCFTCKLCILLKLDLIELDSGDFRFPENSFFLDWYQTGEEPGNASTRCLSRSVKGLFFLRPIYIYYIYIILYRYIDIYQQ